MKVSTGHKYKTRMGDTVTIIRWEQRNFLFPHIGVNECGITSTYNELGRVHIMGKSPNDLVEEVTVDDGDPLETLNLMS